MTIPGDIILKGKRTTPNGYELLLIKNVFACFLLFLLYFV